MCFTYTYRSSDGQRHAAEIEAESRDAAFARLRREFGIRPIKVELKMGDGKVEDGGAKGFKGTIGLILAAVLLVAAAVWLWLVARPESAPYRVMTPQGPVTYTAADPLPRQRIPGDRRRIDEAKGGIGRAKPYGAFKYRAEAFLAGYSEPGRQTGRPANDTPSTKEFDEALNNQLRVAESDFTEVVDLKRIVEGMKREMRAYLAVGGTVKDYLVELEKRQRLEISYRENAEKRLGEMIAAALEHDRHPHRKTSGAPTVNAEARTGDGSYQAAYLYWLKANAQLQAMGIYPLPLPDTFRNHPIDMDFTE